MKRALFLAATALVVAGLAYSLYQVFEVTPIDKALYFSQKIFYWHVPHALLLFVAVIVCGIASVLYLVKRDGRYDDVAEAAGELSVMLGAITLVTGSIWGKAAWGHWWVWDARLTTSLLLWMVMLGYVLVRRYGGPGSERLAAGLAVFGMADVPLIYFSVRIWRTLHPQTSVVPGLQAEMKSAFWLSMLVFTVFFVLLLSARVAQTRSARRLREAREQGLDAGLFE